MLKMKFSPKRPGVFKTSQDKIQHSRLGTLETLQENVQHLLVLSHNKFSSY